MKIKISTVKNYISANVIKSQDATQKLAVLLPGFLDTKDYPSFIEFSSALAKQGFTSICFDPLGTWESTPDISLYSMSQYLRDVQESIHYMQQQNTITYKKIVLIGHSLGGLISMLYSAKNNNISGVIAIMSPQTFIRDDNYHDRYISWKEKGIKTSVRDKPNRQDTTSFTMPFSFVEDSMQYDAIEAVKNIHKPILFIAGEKDKKITPLQVEIIYKEANKPKQFVVLQGIGHDFRYNKDEIAVVNETIKSFLSENNL